MHLHIAGVLVFDASAVPTAGSASSRIRDQVADRVPLVPAVPGADGGGALRPPAPVDGRGPRLRPRLPRPAGQPARSPGGPSELAALVGSIVERRSTGTPPVGVPRGRGARARARGAGHRRSTTRSSTACRGRRCMAAFFDLDPHPRRGGGPTTPPWSPDPVPGEVDRLRGALGVLPGQTDRVARTVGSTVRTVRSLSSRNREAQGTLPPSPFQAPRTSINRAISAHRRVRLGRGAPGRHPTGERRAGRHRQRRGAGHGGRCPAVVLRRARRGAVDSSLVAMVPVSVRERGRPGGPWATGSRHAGVAGHRGGGPGGPPAADQLPGCGRPRSSTRRWGPTSTPAGPRPCSRRWPPG